MASYHHDAVMRLCGRFVAQRRTSTNPHHCEERITTSVLADRLAKLVNSGVLGKPRNVADWRRELYSLTAAGFALIPVLVELANWGVSYDPEVVANSLWTRRVQTDRTGLYKPIHNTVAGGGSVWRGDGSVIEQLQQATNDP
ncbi:MAG TPA: winged helix-turn-helix transcriptional regulator [Solirubrobacteraceae bacterium]|nr:winged helix-turn-helix transcriptional regulator [Solirubrobacteraceae bacterium]